MVQSVFREFNLQDVKMAVPTPLVIRKKIVAAYENNLGTALEIANIFGVSLRSVRLFVMKHRTTGDLTPIPLPGRPPILTEENLDLIRTIVDANPDRTLQQYADDFKNETGITVSYVTIHNACAKIDRNRKKKLPRGRAKQVRCTDKA